jgi:hypothetical protein
VVDTSDSQSEQLDVENTISNLQQIENPMGKVFAVG